MLGSANVLLGSTLKGDKDQNRIHIENGGGWLYKLDIDTVEAIRELVEELPHIIVIGEGKTRINLIHAEFPDETTDEMIDSGQIADDEAGIMWRRSLMLGKSCYGVPRMQPGLSMTVCGHTPKSKPELRGSHLNIDTAAWVSGNLTMLETLEVLSYD